MNENDPARAALLKMISDLEKLPRIGIIDSQTHHKVSYEEVDFIISTARKSIGIEHVSVPNKKNISYYTLHFAGSVKT